MGQTWIVQGEGTRVPVGVPVGRRVSKPEAVGVGEGVDVDEGVGVQVGVKEGVAVEF